MSPSALFAAAGVLGVERLAYLWILGAPGAFRRLCARPAVAWLGEPVAVVRKLFYAFKALQLAVFLGWCHVHGGGTLAPAALDPTALALAAVAIAVGQVLNWSVFYRLGPVGAFFGGRLGHDVAWCRRFPFSVMDHPQYVGTVLTIWGFFLAMRYPGDDWFWLPLVETVYYAAGAYLEERV